MKIKKININYLSVIKHTVLLLTFMLFNCVENSIYPYSTAMFSALMINGSSIYLTPLTYLLSFVLLGASSMLGSVAITAFFYFIVMLIYNKTKTKPHYESLLFSTVSNIGFIIIGDTANFIPLEKRILVSVFIVILSFLCSIGVKAVSEKGLKFKLGFDEYISIATIVALLGLGISNLISPLVFKGIAVLILLLSSTLFKTGTGSLISAVLGLSLSIHFKDLNYVSIFLIWNLFIESFNKLSRYLSALSVICIDYFIQSIFNFYNGYGLREFLPVLIGSVAFCIIPSKPLLTLKEKLYSFREKQLVRQTINRDRMMISNRLFELSSVFNEMANAFHLFRKNDVTEDKVKQGIEKEIYTSICKKCANFDKCKKADPSISYSIGKITDIGFAKGKLSFIDLSKDLLSTCVHPNDILFTINRLLSEYRSYKIESANVISGRDIIAKEAVGVAEILRGLALESGTMLKYHNRTERSLSENLFKAGFTVSEILIYGEDEFTTVSMIVAMHEFSLTTLQSVISKSLGAEYMLCDKADISEDKCFLAFRQTADFDAVFGFSKATKDNSQTSGDTHSVVRLNGNKFILALSDGMGSGEQAQTVSAASLSLIESFYKAGLSSELILNTVNKLLSINTEDSFTALDISVIDLKSCQADFIKYGAPYGFIIGENGIRIIEGNSLPLGIIDELKPSVCSTELNDGDIILLLTDGISDAFGSSGDIIDYLRSVPAKNPQSLADSILEKALSLTNGQKNDDMTALAVRIYRRRQKIIA